MSQGRRYNEQKLNIKKVIAVIIAIAVVIMFFVGLAKVLGKDSPLKEKNVAVKYFAVYTDGKYGVINSKGDIVIKPTYDEMIIIPNQTKDLFFCTENVDYENGTYQTKAIDKKEKKQYESYDSVEPIQSINTQNVVTYEGEILKVRKDGKFGIIDYKGNKLLACEYDKIESLKGVSKSILIEKDGKVGLADNTGSIIIEPKYKEIKPLTDEYSDGYIVKGEEGKLGLVKYTKEKVLEEEYEKIDSVTGNDLYSVTKDGKKQIVRKGGEKVFDVTADTIVTITRDSIIAEKNGKYGLLDSEGKEKLGFTYDMLEYAFSNYYIASKNGKSEIIKDNGEKVIETQYETIRYRKDENFFEAGKEGEVASDLIDGATFEVKLTGIISEISADQGYMKVRIGNEYKYYNFKFEEKNVQEILSTNEIYLSKQDGKYGFVNKDGVVIVNYEYDDATELNSYGYAAVKKDGKWGCIDHTGKVIVEPTYPFENHAVIDFIGKWHYGEDINANYYTDEK